MQHEPSGLFLAATQDLFYLFAFLLETAQKQFSRLF